MKTKMGYQVLTWSGVVVIAFLMLWMIRAGWSGKFHSVESMQQYIQSFGVFGPVMLILIQAFQVVVPILPGFLGSIVGTALFGVAGGFWCNYIGISAGSIIAYFLARRYGAPLVEQIFPKEKYVRWIQRFEMSKSYTWFFFLCILLPLAPDDFLCYFSGLIQMRGKKFVAIILAAKPWCLLFYSLGFGAIFRII